MSDRARWQRNARQLVDLAGVWIAEYVVSAYIIVTTLVLTAIGILALGYGLWVFVTLTALITLSCFLGFRHDYRKAMANKIWGFLMGTRSDQAPSLAPRTSNTSTGPSDRG